MKTYAIMGASGHIGSHIAERLLELGNKVRVIARRREKLEPLVSRGAKAAEGDATDTQFLVRTFRGTDGVFAMIPPDLRAEHVRATQARIGISIAEALSKAGVKHVVNLSSQGAHLTAGTGPIVGLHEQEERLNSIPGLNVVHLRAAFFMENLANGIGMIKTQGLHGTPLRGDLRIPVIATRDIARVAVDYLLGLRFSGITVRDLLGQRDLSMVEMTQILGKAIGKPDLRYVQFPYDAAREAMLGLGLSADVSRAFIEMYEALNEGRIMGGVARTPENTTETSFEDYAVEFARLYAAQPAEAPSSRQAVEPPRPVQEEAHRNIWEVLSHRRRAA